MKKFLAIIFDMDGVIIDSNKVWLEANTQFIGKRGGQFNPEHRSLISGRSPVEAIRILQDIYDIEGDPEVLSEERKQIVYKIYETQLDFVEGFEEFINQLIAQEMTRAIATGSDYALLEKINAKLNLPKYFGDKIYSSQDVNFVSKPDPAIFLYTAKKIEVDPEKCLVIEDSPLGIEAAKRANMQVVGLTKLVTNKESLSQADLVVEDFAEIDIV